MAMYDVKVVKTSDHIYEVYYYEYMIQLGGVAGGRVGGNGNGKNVEKNRKDSTHRARERVRRLVNSNFKDSDLFITLTFKDDAVGDVKDVKECNNYFKKFIQRFRYYYGRDFKYLAVIEFQDKNGRGAVHYHMLVDLEYIEKEYFENEIWKGGFTFLKNIKGVDNIGAYMVKYMTKNINDKRLMGEKSYLSSRNLKKPSVLKGDDAKEIIEAYALDERKAVYENTYNTDYYGKVMYREYNLKR